MVMESPDIAVLSGPPSEAIMTSYFFRTLPRAYNLLVYCQVSVSL